MEALPTETLQSIFELACTDGGYTGCSLSCVSKRVRAAASTIRFQSVSLVVNSHRRRLQSFVALYQRESGGGQAKIILIVALAEVRVDATQSATTLSARVSPAPIPQADADAMAPTLECPPYPGLPLETLCSTPPDARPDQGTTGTLVATAQPVASPHAQELTPAHFGAARTLFRLASPDLISLVVQCGFKSGGDLHLHAIERPFPLLREVTFVGVADPLTVFDDGADASPLFPAATHLYIVPHNRPRPSILVRTRS
ncbi:hypothetical protein BV20DRAFT_1051825 [Pilatotrama ljubarskyi]|nr:hypothetical protein BV20DRAFT_1051825 [Pilatotrama ljubarskyi]